MPPAPLAALVRSPHLRVHLLGAFHLVRETDYRAGQVIRTLRAQSLDLITRKAVSLHAYLNLHPEPHASNLFSIFPIGFALEAAEANRHWSLDSRPTGTPVP